jgi:hypothetical protein
MATPSVGRLKVLMVVGDSHKGPLNNQVYSLRLKKNDVVGFKICPKKNDVLLNLACVHVHVGMQQSIST